MNTHVKNLFIEAKQILDNGESRMTAYTALVGYDQYITLTIYRAFVQFVNTYFEGDVVDFDDPKFISKYASAWKNGQCKVFEEV